MARTVAQYHHAKSSLQAVIVTAVEKLILFTAMIVSVMACQQVPDPAALRNAHNDPARYFDNDRLRADTLTACHAGDASSQTAWASLYACKTASATDHAKRSGWKPNVDSASPR